MSLSCVRHRVFEVCPYVSAPYSSFVGSRFIICMLRFLALLNITRHKVTMYELWFLTCRRRYGITHRKSPSNVGAAVTPRPVAQHRMMLQRRRRKSPLKSWGNVSPLFIKQCMITRYVWGYMWGGIQDICNSCSPCSQQNGITLLYLKPIAALTRVGH